MATYFITPGYWHVISDAVHDSNALSVETLRQQHSEFTVQMRRLICAFVVRIWQKQVFSWRGSIVDWNKLQENSYDFKDVEWIKL